ncbi:5-methyltetrahydropteroyltriglutamate--homocysteine S-methyltransferase [Actinomadura madurae]|uniref:5-methyltetrahydropteroyltriglutamate-- homocysteine S-methyltransferase n=1 Tax=Actinomadura madurae TaxID=1993 RepID=UPI0020D20769|nr:5-methyltetrahydropteroyltriglutamate--homocysteine S-methyltransferase [Actinomadura madurae]MCP9951813.1 5-methyltetrahydropteroyltriglutamate--homocysteine S-methyltransferase [Actinomadura madurae]MCP9981057.1 5-methyltetrahydropteroyltriglutamate--homocysteine S-methyltransferase [Actinomadura madurae]MCQ0007446.1 5-methyltetrahydropteroyltriglutamate--homocysteine S-methyltransferase [Actinomadura madurae]
MNTTILGYPRIGPNRELKVATENYWAGRADAGALVEAGARLRAEVWTQLRDAGLGSVPSNTFSFYDHVLDTSVLVDAIPERYRHLTGFDRYFAMARGVQDVPPLEMTKWYDTNYHYIVPEVGPGTRFRLAEGAAAKPLAEYREARALGIETRPVLVGPLTYLLLAKPAVDGFRPLSLLDGLVDVYAEVLERLAGAGAEWVQLDEPALVEDRTSEEIDALARAYARLGRLTSRPRLMVATYFGTIGVDALRVLARSRVEAVGLDLVAGAQNVDVLASVGGLPRKTLVAGVVDGRNVWRTDQRRARATTASLLGLVDRLVVSTSCSLMHVPIDLEAETSLATEVRSRLAFARQKVGEVVALGRALREDVPAEATAAGPAVDGAVRERVKAIGDARRGDRAVRFAAQREALGLPALATTTIGSFPQTPEIRRIRADRRAGRITEEAYTRAMKDEIARVIALQEDLGLDVLVHGEPERNDMVQYFAEQLDGYAATEHGWVQSYGSRYVRPPILHGDVARPRPMTVEWATYAQSLTSRPVKGMLTGPVTMLAWSFVRDDEPLADTARQVALALRDEIADLEAAGIRVIQVDEPALRELLPLRAADRPAYLDWAVGAFRLATSGVADSTQIHTHMCYSEFGEIIGAIGALDADVTSVEAARSRMELVGDLRAAGYENGIGPGVYDIHSPRVPSAEEMEDNLRRALRAVEPARLWVNPDCGLKTRAYPETEASLRNLVAAARRVREEVAG